MRKKFYEAFCMDPFNPSDKDNNSHLLLLGSTGSGKSATSTDLLIKLMGTYKPYLVMVDGGNSFHLLKDFFAESGLSVHHVAISLDNPPILNPFVDSMAMLKQLESFGNEAPNKLLEVVESRLEADAKAATVLAFDNADQAASRDYLGEMAERKKLMDEQGVTELEAARLVAASL